VGQPSLLIDQITVGGTSTWSSGARRRSLVCGAAARW